MAQHGTSDRNTESHEDDGSRCPGAGCDCPECTEQQAMRASFEQAYQEAFPEPDLCIFCVQYPAKEHSDYCSDSCAILASNE